MFRWAEILWYVTIFVSLVAAGFGAPIPEEAPIVTAGVLVGHSESAPPVPPEALGVFTANPQVGFPASVPWTGLANAQAAKRPLALRWWIMLPLCILGVVISDGLLYGIGRHWGVRVLDFPWMQRLLPRERLFEIERNFQERGVLILLFARMLPGIRAPIFLTAGIMKLSLQRFLLADGIYAIPGVSLLFFLSYWFTEQFKKVMDRIDSVRPLIVVAVIAAVGGYFVYHFLNRPVTTGDPKEIPLIGDQVAARLGKSSVHDATAVRDALAARDARAPRPAATPPPGEPSPKR